MKKPTRRSRFAFCTLLAVSALSTGCNPIDWIGPNLFVSLNIPLGLGGTPGLLNPFGIIQALVNASLGTTTAGTGDTATLPTPESGVNIGDINGALGGTIAPPQPPTVF